jgi:hypothetical protein
MPKRPHHREAAFAAKGATLTARVQKSAPTAGQGARVTLDKGATLDADLLLVAAGVAPVTDYLAGSGVAVEPRHPGRRHHAHQRRQRIWAAGDVAQAKGFYDEAKMINAHPARAPSSRAGSPAWRWPAIPASSPTPAACRSTPTPSSASRRSPSAARMPEGEVVTRFDEAERPLPEDRHARATAHRHLRRQRILRPGVMWEFILRRIDLSVREEIASSPSREVGANSCRRTWR